MKYKNLGLASLFCLFCVFMSCKDKETCTGVIYTYTQDEQGIKTPLGHCRLVFGEPDFAPEMRRDTVTNAQGYYEGTWLREAYLRIVATGIIMRTEDSTIYEDHYHGTGYIRLEAGNRVEEEIILTLQGS